MQTLPVLCTGWALSLDVVRRFIAGRPELKQLGTQVGSTRGFTEDEALAIKRALDTRVDRRRREYRQPVATG